MKTIAFYSYKGGVGRSLAVSNSAYYLSRQGKTVFILDMDFEAPGMHYKLEQYNKPIKPEKGIIDFLTASRKQGQTDITLSKYVIKLESTEREMKDMWLMPAGDPMSRTYWQQMADIEWKDFLYNEEQVGVKLFWDLKHLIQEQYNPDFLLIDSRTGLTDLTGISLSLLADEVVILAVNNPENIDGSRLVMEKLERMASSAELKMPALHFVITRLPVPIKGGDWERELQIKERTLRLINLGLLDEKDYRVNKINIIHIDPEQALGERFRFKEENWEKHSITIDYIYLVTLFAELESLHPVFRFQELWRKFQKSEHPEDKKELAIELVFIETKVPIFEFNRGYIADEFLGDLELAIKAFSNAIELNRDFDHAYAARALARRNLEEYSAALDDYNKLISLNPEDGSWYDLRGVTYVELEDYSRAIADFDKALDLNHKDAEVYNNRGVAYQRMKNYTSAIASYSHAISFDPQEAVFYYNRGDTFYELENYSAAIDDYSKAIELGLMSVDVYNNRGISYQCIENYSSALADYNKVLEIDPVHEFAQYNKKILLELMKDF